MTDKIPLGLSFSYLKGSLMWMDELLAEVSPQSLRRARIQLAEALDKYNHALVHDQETSAIVKKTLSPLGAILIAEAHIMLLTASSLLSSGLKLQ